MRAIIEQSSEGLFAARIEEVPGAYGFGLSEAEAKAELIQILQEQADYYKSKKGVYPDWYTDDMVDYMYDDDLLNIDKAEMKNDLLAPLYGVLDKLTLREIEELKEAIRIREQALADDEVKETVTSIEQRQTTRKQVEDIMGTISWHYVVMNYFCGKSSSWFYDRLYERELNENGKPAKFSPEELAKLKGALVDIAELLRKTADKL